MGGGPPHLLHRGTLHARLTVLEARNDDLRPEARAVGVERGACGGVHREGGRLNRSLAYGHRAVASRRLEDAAAMRERDHREAFAELGRGRELDECEERGRQLDRCLTHGRLAVRRLTGKDVEHAQDGVVPRVRGLPREQLWRELGGERAWRRPCWRYARRRRRARAIAARRRRRRWRRVRVLARRWPARAQHAVGWGRWKAARSGVRRQPEQQRLRATKGCEGRRSRTCRRRPGSRAPQRLGTRALRRRGQGAGPRHSR